MKNKISRIQKMLLFKMEIQSYPWRFITDPYKVLISEFCLQRTRASQVLPVYLELISRFPNINLFVNTEKDSIIQIMKPLGLYWRIDGMINSINCLFNEYGEVPVNYEKLFKIKGIGQYIAGAVVCFTKNEKFVLIDANIVRVIGRLFNANLSGEARRRKEIYNLVSTTVPSDNSRKFYYSIIDLAHLFCLPKNEICRDCLLKDFCEYSILKLEMVKNN
ncbi:MAG: hypothetical protein AB2L18_11745 [Anaerolineaceae bacterium]